MELLFFDIECCDGKHICEFGYVLTDIAFNVIERDVITINPDKPFSLSRKSNQGELELFYSDTKYYLSPIFPEYHSRIKALIEAPDRLVIGYAIGNDAKFLKTACSRYELEPINFKFCDSQMIYDLYTNSENSTSLETAISAFKLPPPEYYHRSDCDAYGTMLLVKELCRRMDMPVERIFELCEYSVGSIDGNEITMNNARFKWEKILLELESGELSPKQKKTLLNRFFVRAEKTEQLDVKEIAGKKICFDTYFEKHYLRELLGIIQKIVNAGGGYTVQMEECDIFVNTASKDPKENLRLKMARDAKIKIWTADEIYALLGISFDEMKSFPLPSLELLMKPIKSEPPKKKKTTAGDGAPTTLRDIFAKKGIRFGE